MKKFAIMALIIISLLMVTSVASAERGRLPGDPNLTAFSTRGSLSR